MKIIHCADIHADSAMSSSFSKELRGFSKEKGEMRREEIVDAFSRMIDFANKNEVKVVIIAGDLFDTRASLQKTIKKRIAYIISQNPHIDFLYLRGNHDEDSEFFIEDNLPNLKLFSKNEWKTYSYDDGKIQIVGREFNSSIPVAAYNELNLDVSKTNIVVMHGQVAGYVAKDDAPVISLPKLANQNIDYIALGHIHEYRREVLDHRCVWCYSGCLEGRGFDECGEKGFVLLNVEEGRVEESFVPNSYRIIHDVSVRLEGEMDYNQILHAIEKEVEDIPSKDIVQVKLVGEISENTDVETDSYTKVFESRFFYIKLKNNCESKIDYEKYENDVSLKGEFVRLVKQQEKLSDSQKTRIIMTGIKALAGRNF